MRINVTTTHIHLTDETLLQVYLSNIMKTMLHFDSVSVHEMCLHQRLTDAKVKQLCVRCFVDNRRFQLKIDYNSVVNRNIISF